MPLLTEQNPVLETGVLEILAFAVPLLIVPALIITQLVVESPLLRREPAASRRRTAAAVLAVISLVVAAPLLLMVWALGVFGLLLLGGLVVPALLTLNRLRQPLPPPPITGATHGD
ncbi:hypothetical protein [Kocuria sp. U4B]